MIGRDVEALVPEQQVGVHRTVRAAYEEKPEVRLNLRRDLSGRRKDGSEFPVEIGLNPIGGQGWRAAVLATVMDISARKQAEGNQQLLIGELKHRTGNLLTIVQAITSNTLKNAKTTAEAGHVLKGRLNALSGAYSMLADQAWEGTSLVKVLSGQPNLDSKRVSIEGCEIVITPRAAQQFAMIAHELATNALKYGALSVPDGRVSIAGKLDRYNGNGSFVFLWKETGGPKVSQPIRRGFGSTILMESAEQFGHVTATYPPDGLVYQIELDLTTIEVPKAS